MLVSLSDRELVLNLLWNCYQTNAVTPTPTPFRIVITQIWETCSNTLQNDQRSTRNPSKHPSCNHETNIQKGTIPGTSIDWMFCVTMLFKCMCYVTLHGRMIVWTENDAERCGHGTVPTFRYTEENHKIARISGLQAEFRSWDFLSSLLSFYIFRPSNSSSFHCSNNHNSLFVTGFKL
jgi:hypothetical protein